VFKSAKTLHDQGKTTEALAGLRDALRRDQLDPAETERAGRLIARFFAASGQKTVRVALLGQCTTSWLLASLTATAWGQGMALTITEGGYDTILQDLVALTPGSQAPEVIILLPWSARLLASKGAAEDRIGQEVDFWSQTRQLASSRLGARLVQVGYDWVIPGPLGYCMAGQPGGSLDLVRCVNAGLRAGLPADAFFVDLEAVSGTMGRASFYDMRRYYWTKQPFSEPGTKLLAEHLAAGIRAVTTGPKKVLALDLDNTVWGGVVGEVGPHGIALGESADGEAFRALQAHAKGLAERGIVLTAVSKNNTEDAREPFQTNSDMILKLDDFGAWEVNWEPKGRTLARAAETLNLGIDSFVFVDDNPAEREQVRQAQPEVLVVEIPEEPAEYVRALQAGLWFEATSLTSEDRERSTQYVTEKKRRELQQSFTSMDDYLRSLEMIGEIKPIDDADLLRVVQLFAKTNQFNLTTRRHSREDVLALTAQRRSVHMTLRVRDRFGDHGLIGLLVGVAAEQDAQALRIDSWLMSCRVIGRTVEEFCFQETARSARQLGYRQLIGEYIPTKKNALVATLYERLGFRKQQTVDDGTVLYTFDLIQDNTPTTFVNVVQSEPLAEPT
jgi:FkbH-like protein